MIIVIGNGKSRLKFNLDTIKQKAFTIGCNALYRDFSPDILVANDAPMIHEILSSNYTKSNTLYIKSQSKIKHEHRKCLDVLNKIKYENANSNYKFFLNGVGGPGIYDFYLTWYHKNDKIKYFPWEDDWGMCTGITAIRLAYELYPEEEIFLVGFDIFGERNNVYDGTNCYPEENTPNIVGGGERGFLGGFEKILTIYNRIKIKRVTNQSKCVPNIENISEEELWQKLIP